jgi:hypothetical protein
MYIVHSYLQFTLTLSKHIFYFPNIVMLKFLHRKLFIFKDVECIINFNY